MAGPQYIELANTYVSIVPTVKGAAEALDRAFSSNKEQWEKTSARLGNRMVEAIMKLWKDATKKYNMASGFVTKLRADIQKASPELKAEYKKMGENITRITSNWSELNRNIIKSSFGRIKEDLNIGGVRASVSKEMAGISAAFVGVGAGAVETGKRLKQAFNDSKLGKALAPEFEKIQAKANSAFNTVIVQSVKAAAAIDFFMIPFRRMASAAEAAINKLVGAFVGLGERIKKAIEPIKAKFAEVFDKVKESASKFVDSVKDRFSKIHEAVSNVAGKITAPFAKAFGAVSNIFQPLTAAVGNLSSTIGKGVSGAVSYAGGAIKTLATEHAQTLYGLVSNTTGTIGKLKGAIKQGAQGMFKVLPEETQKTLSGMAEKLKSFSPASHLMGPLKAMGNTVGFFAGQAGKALEASFNTAVAGCIAAIGALSAAIASQLGGAIERVDTAHNFPRIMQNMKVSTEDASGALAKMDKAITGLPTKLNEMTDMSVALKSAMPDKEMSYVSDVAISLNNALLAGGKGAAEANRAFTQYTQQLAKGSVDMQSYRALMEVMPAQLNQIAEALLGAGHNSQELYTAMKTGQVSFDDFNAALIKLNGQGVNGFASFTDQAKSATRGIATAWENVKNQIQRGLARVIEAIGYDRILNVIMKVQEYTKAFFNEIVKFIEVANKDGSSALSGFSAIIPVIGAALGFLLPNLPIIGGLFSGLTAGVGLFIGVIVLAWTKSKEFRDSVANLGGEILKLGQALDPTITQLQKFVDAFGVTTGHLLGGIVDKLITPIVSGASKIEGPLTNIVSMVTAYILPVVSVLGDMLIDVVALVEQFAGGLLGALIEKLASAFARMLPPIKAAADAFKKLWDFIMPVLVPAFRIVGSIIGWIIGLVADMSAALISGVLKRVTGAFESLGPSIDKAAPKMQAFADKMVKGFNDIKHWVDQAWGKIAPFFEWLGSVTAGAGVAVIKLIVDALIGLYNGGKKLVDELMPYLKPLFDQLVSWFNTLKQVFVDYVVPALKVGWDALKVAFQVGGDIIGAVFKAVGAVLKWVWDWIIGPVFELIKVGIKVLLWVINLNIELIKAAFRGMAAVAQWVWDHGLKQTWDLIKSGAKAVGDWYQSTLAPIFTSFWNGIKSGFKTMGDAVGKAWDGIKDAAKTPVKFVIETVYNKGLKNWFNTAASTIGIKTRLPNITAGFASGGVLPGYTPGRDVHKFYSPTAGALELSGGEAIMRPEWVKAVGGPEAVHRMNRLAIQSGGHAFSYGGDAGQTAFADGGILGDAWGWVTDKAGKAWNWTKDKAKSIGYAFTHPLETIEKLVLAPTRALLGKVGSGAVGDMVKAMPPMWFDRLKQIFKGETEKIGGGDLVNTARKAIGTPYVWGGVNVPGGVDCSGLIVWALRQMGKNVPRHTASTFQANSSPIGSPAPGDLAFWGGAPGVGGAHHVAVVSGPGRIIEAPTFGIPVRETGVYGAVNYGHFKYDQGGWLRPGITTVVNKTGKPEPVFTSNQWQTLKNKGVDKASLVEALNGLSVTLNVGGQDMNAYLDVREAPTNAAVSKRKINEILGL